MPVRLNRSDEILINILFCLSAIICAISFVINHYAYEKLENQKFHYNIETTCDIEEIYDVNDNYTTFEIFVYEKDIKTRYSDPITKGYMYETVEINTERYDKFDNKIKTKDSKCFIQEKNNTKNFYFESLKNQRKINKQEKIFKISHICFFLGIFLICILQVVFLLFYCFIMLIKCIFCSESEEQEEEQEENSNVIINIEEIKNDIQDEELNQECSICLENMDNKNTLKKLNCKHLFHTECINRWVLNNNVIEHNSCPNCRQEIV